MPGGVPDGVEVTCREKGGIRYIFIQNFSGRQEAIALPEGTVIWGKDGVLAPLETVVVRCGG